MNQFPGYLVGNLAVAANLRIADERTKERERIEALSVRLDAVGGHFAGQDLLEGIIDRDGIWHDIGTSNMADEDVLVHAESIIAELERQKARREREEQRNNRGPWFEYEDD